MSFCISVSRTRGGERRGRFLRFFSPVLAFMLMFCLALPLSAAAAEKPAYLKSVTYFGDQWPINFWSSEDDEMEANMARIAADGFNSIILVVPWREFQPETDPVAYSDYPFKKLDAIMDCAERHGLWVSLRVGYCWDYAGTSGVPARYTEILKPESRARAAWLDYCRTLYAAASAHGNFYGGFITWEDFWDYTYSLEREIPARERIQMAKDCGYTKYLEERYSIEQVSEAYGAGFSDFSQVYLPYKTHPSASLFYDFYDEFLMNLMKESQAVFPELSMEVRVDGDVIYDGDGNQTYYSHGRTFACEGAPYSAIMYSVSMGQANNYERISAEQALSAMRTHLGNISAIAGGKPLFIEQLLYMDTTAEFSYNAQIEENQVDDYIMGLSPILKDYSNGYGLWVYRNYVNNCVYNAQFALGTKGWTASSGVRAESHDGSQAIALPSGESISQKLLKKFDRNDTVYVEFYAYSEAGADMTVKVGDYERVVRVSGPTRFVYSIPSTADCVLSFTSDKGEVVIDDVKIYTYEQEGRIYDTDGSELDLAGASRTLNGQLN